MKYRTPPTEEAFEALPYAACVLDASARVLRINAAARELFAVGDEDCIGKSALEYVDDEATPAARESLRAACVEHRVFVGEVLWNRISGSAFWNDIVLVPLDLGDELIMISRDVTARRTAESWLGTVPAHDRLILDRVQAGVIVHAASTEILYANAKALEILGVSSESALLATNDDPRWGFLRADGTAMPLEEFPVGVAVRSKQVARDIIIGHRRPSDGRLVWFVCNAYPVLDRSGTVVEVIVSFTDVTPLKEAERELAKSQERLSLVMAGSGDAPWDWEVATNTSYYSPRYFEMLGYAEGDFPIGFDTWVQLTVPEDRDRVHREFVGHLESAATTFEIEFSMLHRSGRALRILSRGFIQRDANGAVIRVAGSNADVTEQRAMEARLRQSQKLEAIGQLAGGVAHDFNNALAVVIGNLDLIRSDLPDDSELAELLDDALTAAQRGAELTRRLLAFSRQQTLATTVVDLANVVHGMTAMIRRLLGETVCVDVTVPNTLPAVRVDAAQLENVLLNLSINARDAMPGGGVLSIRLDEVTLATGEGANVELPVGKYVRLSLSDTGCGISQDLLGRVLEPFFTTKPTGSGTGLGLSMAYGFARQSGGTLQLSSEPGQGTTVEILLPATREDVDAAANGRMRSGEPRKAPKRSETVLVVEDDESVRRLCVRSLETLGFSALSASDGPTALKVIEEAPRVDLVLTDVVMPGGMTGRDLAVKTRETHPHLRILYMSGYSAEVFEGDDPAVLDHLLPKPFTVEDLALAIQEVLADTR